MSTLDGGALEGVRVLDLTQMLAGPFSTLLLAEQGAEVIKIEPPEGDVARRIGPFHRDDRERAFGGYFQSINRNKSSLTLDLKTAEGRGEFLGLVRSADMVVENFRSGVMERLGLSYEVLAAINPKLVYGSIRGFGDPRGGDSPYSAWPALDVVAQSMGGMMGITGADVETPVKIGPGVGDTVPGLFLAFGLMCALYRARTTGQGQYVDVGMVDSIFALCERIAHQYSYGGVVAKPEGNRHPLLCPFGIVKAKDGFVTLACPADDFWKALCGALDLSDMARDPRYATNEARVAHSDEVYALLESRTRELTKRELADLLGGRVPFGPVYSAADIFADPHFRARDMLVDLPHPGLDGTRAVAGTVVKLLGTPGPVPRRAPLLDENRGEILGGVGAAA